jgi:hypothetical protein
MMRAGEVISSRTRQIVKMDPMPMDSEIARLKREVSRLQAQLKAQQTPTTEFTDLRNNYEFTIDLARFCEGGRDRTERAEKMALVRKRLDRIG